MTNSVETRHHRRHPLRLLLVLPFLLGRLLRRLEVGDRSLRRVKRKGNVSRCSTGGRRGRVAHPELLQLPLELRVLLLQRVRRDRRLLALVDESLQLQPQVGNLARHRLVLGQGNRLLFFEGVELFPKVADDLVGRRDLRFLCSVRE